MNEKERRKLRTKIEWTERKRVAGKQREGRREELRNFGEHFFSSLEEGRKGALPLICNRCLSALAAPSDDTPTVSHPPSLPLSFLISFIFLHRG